MLSNNRVGKKRIILFLFLSWLPYCIMSFPGNISYDTGTMIDYFLGTMKQNPNNPFYLNYLFYAVYKIGKIMGNPSIGITLYCVIQCAAEIILLCCIIKDENKKVRPVFALLLLLWYGLIPIFPMYAFTMSKDSIFAFAVLLFVFLSIRCIHDSEKFWSGRVMWLLPIDIVIMGMCRNHAWLIPAVSFFLFAVFSVKRKRAILISALTVCASFAINVFLPTSIGVPSVELKESMSIPLQTTAYYTLVHEAEVTSDEKQTIGLVVPYEEMRNYNPMIADPIKDKSKFSHTTMKSFLRMWRDMFIKHPRTILKSFYDSTYVYYTPWAFSGIKPHIHIGFEADASVRENAGLNNSNRNLETIRTIDNFILKIPILGLFSKIGIYTWMLIISVVIILFKRQWPYLFPCSVLIMILGGCLLSPVNGYFRYAYGMILSVPVFLFETFSCPTLKNKTTSNQHD